ncbi:MAG: hypothetical protein NDI61_01185 [Bdellovibrionaceae bacterium]|nr:hypothetical protein [Pseudobdellovibrionaceae bacterium]
MVRAFSLMCVASLVWGCQTMKPREDITPTSQQGAWTAKTLIQDKKRGKSNTVEIEFVARRPGQLRMEVLSVMGFHLASFVVSHDTMSYALTREKKYWTGPANPAVMKNLIQISLDPKIIIDLLFDRHFDARQWECTLDESRQPGQCASRDGELKIVWSERTSDKRLVQIRAANADVTMSLKETESKVQIQDSLFELSTP